MFFIIERVTALAGLRQVFFQMGRRNQRGVGVGVQSFTVQQRGDVIFRELRQKRFTRAGSMHRQFAADGGGHAHQLSTLYLVDNNRLMIALIQHRQVDGLTGGFHQFTQHRVHNRQ